MIDRTSDAKRLLQFGTADHGLGRLNSPRSARARARLGNAPRRFGMFLAELDAMPMKDLR
jgi:hypothetical protein